MVDLNTKIEMKIIVNDFFAGSLDPGGDVSTCSTSLASASYERVSGTQMLLAWGRGSLAGSWLALMMMGGKQMGRMTPTRLPTKAMRTLLYEADMAMAACRPDTSVCCDPLFCDG